MSQSQFGGAKVIKSIQLNSSAKEGLINGINQLADAVGSTLGAGGKTVIIEDDFGGASVTKDGVSVAESITLKDPVENLGVTLIKQAAKQTATKAGDGTTTSTVLAQALIKNFKYNDKYSFRDVRSGVEKFKDAVIEELDKRSIQLDDDKLKQVSTISSNNDKELGALIADAFISAGEDGVVTVTNSLTGNTYVDTVEGTKISSVASHHVFFTNQEREIAELDNPYIFLSATEISTVPIIEKVLEHVIRLNRSLLIVSKTGTQLLTALASNRVKGNIKVLVIDPPSFGLKQSDILDDLALLTGAAKYDESLGDSVDLITPDMLGEADKVISDKNGTIFFVNNDSTAVKDRVSHIKKELEDIKEGSPLIRHLQNRLSLLQGGVSQIRVGADTEPEQKELLDRTDDAVQAVRAARKEGIVPGGGAALYYLANTVDIKGNKGELEGARILKQTLASPHLKILNNAGLDPDKFVIDKWGNGVNAITGEIVNMLEEGIIDPTLVTKEALKNAVSVALTILSTDAVVSNIRLD